MPTALPELRAKMEEYFGDAISDQGPQQFLLEQGWVEDRFLWFAPAGEISDKEWDCMQFLIDEWDFDYQGRIK